MDLRVIVVKKAKKKKINKYILTRWLPGRYSRIKYNFSPVWNAYNKSTMNGN